MNFFNMFVGGDNSKKPNYLIASGAAFVTLWGFFLAAILMMLITSSALIALHEDASNECSIEHQDWLLKMGIAGVVFSGICIIPLIVIFVVNHNWISQFSIADMNPIIRTSAEHARLEKHGTS